jgi:hypothetical protein
MEFFLCAHSYQCRKKVVLATSSNYKVVIVTFWSKISKKSSDHFALVCVRKVNAHIMDKFLRSPFKLSAHDKRNEEILKYRIDFKFLTGGLEIVK